MRTAGYVLAGGRSLRMGRDKTLLPWRGTVLASYVAGEVLAAATQVTLIGPTENLMGLGFAVRQDLRPDFGPLGGLETALAFSEAEWNLIVACDLPDIDRGTLAAILGMAQRCDSLAVIPAHPNGFFEPLCAAYHTRALPAVRRALDQNSLKMKDFLSQIEVVHWPVSDPRPFRNVNTPDQWEAHV